MTITLAQCLYQLKPVRAGQSHQNCGHVHGEKQSIKEITVHTGIIGSDYEEIIVICVPTVWTFEKGERSAQILLLPFVMPSHSDCPRIGGIGSTNPLTASANPLVAFISKFKMAEQPLVTLEIHGKKFKVIFNTSADVSIISLQY